MSNVKRNSEFQTKRKQHKNLRIRCNEGVKWTCIDSNYCYRSMKSLLKRKDKSKKRHCLFYFISSPLLIFPFLSVSLFSFLVVFFCCSHWVISQSLITFSVRWSNFVCIVSIADNKQTQNIQHDYGIYIGVQHCHYRSKRVRCLLRPYQCRQHHHSTKAPFASCISLIFFL